MKLYFATRNQGKVAELRELVADLGVQVLSLDEAERDVPEVVEDGDTFEANASKKALEVSTALGAPALADDSGLEVDALDGRPGVHSARFAGSHGDDEANNDKLLEAMADVEDDRRGARFVSVLALADVTGALGGDVLTARGECPGTILRERRGTGGFGYDSLFYVAELGATFAELGVGTKNQQSHRARAMKALYPRLVDYLRLAKGETEG